MTAALDVLLRTCNCLPLLHARTRDSIHTDTYHGTLYTRSGIAAEPGMRTESTSGDRLRRGPDASSVLRGRHRATVPKSDDQGIYAVSEYTCLSWC